MRFHYTSYSNENELSLNYNMVWKYTLYIESMRIDNVELWTELMCIESMSIDNVELWTELMCIEYTFLWTNFWMYTECELFRTII